MPSYKNILTARNLVFNTILVAETDHAPKMRSIRRFAPKPRAKQVSAPDPTLPAYQRVLKLLQGSTVEKKAKMITGSVDEAVDEIVAFISESVA
jgi:electron transfer flavoprotein beta subunit